LLYYQIDIESSEEKLDKKNMENPDKDIKKDINNITSDKKYFERFLFLEDRDIYMIDYKGIPMIFQKNKGLFYSVNIISTNFESSAEFLFKKGGRGYATTFINADVNKELLKTKGEMTKTQNEIDSLGNNEERKSSIKNWHNLTKLMIP